MTVCESFKSGKVTHTWIPFLDLNSCVPKDFETFQNWAKQDSYNLVIYGWLLRQLKQIPYEIKTFLMQEMFKRGILTLGVHNLSFSHSKKDIDKLISSYAEVLPMIKIHVDNNSLIENIQGEILEPLFKVR